MAPHLELYGRYNLESMGYYIIIMVKGHELGVGRKMGVGLGGEVKGRSQGWIWSKYTVWRSQSIIKIYIFWKNYFLRVGMVHWLIWLGAPMQWAACSVYAQPPLLMVMPPPSRLVVRIKNVAVWQAWAFYKALGGESYILGKIGFYFFFSLYAAEFFWRKKNNWWFFFFFKAKP